jgi:hypothetical protein
MTAHTAIDRSRACEIASMAGPDSSLLCASIAAICALCLGPGSYWFLPLGRTDVAVAFLGLAFLGFLVAPAAVLAVRGTTWLDWPKAVVVHTVVLSAAILATGFAGIGRSLVWQLPLPTAEGAQFLAATIVVVAFGRGVVDSMKNVRIERPRILWGTRVASLSVLVVAWATVNAMRGDGGADLTGAFMWGSSIVSLLYGFSAPWATAVWVRAHPAM